MDASVYIGPYIKISGDLTTSKTLIKRVCPNGHKVADDAAFCSQCGLRTTKESFEKKEKLRPYTILWNELEREDDLWSPQGLDKTLIPNNRPKEYIRLNVDDTDEVDLTNKDLNNLKKEHIIWFHDEYTKHVIVLRKYYGDDNVKVCWGIITYWS